MKENKAKILLILFLLLSHLTAYILGSVNIRKVMLNGFADEFKKAESNVRLGRYLEFRDIARNLNAKNYSKAKCAAELSASTRYDDLKVCLKDKECRIIVEVDTKEIAPELLGKSPLGFNYIKGKSGIYSCD